MSPPHFPIGPHELLGSWSFDGVDEGFHKIGAFEVLAREIPHKGGRTFGYRVSHGGVSLAYLPDHDASGPRAGAAELAHGVDLLIHDAQFTDGEVGIARHFGHATISETMALAEAARARQVVLFHHAPARTDDELDDIAAASGALVAVEGQSLYLGD